MEKKSDERKEKEVSYDVFFSSFLNKNKSVEKSLPRTNKRFFFKIVTILYPICI